MALKDVSDRQLENGYTVAESKQPDKQTWKPIETDDVVSKIVGYNVKGDDKRLIQFVVQLKKEFGPEAQVQYLLNTNQEVQEKLKALFT